MLYVYGLMYYHFYYIIINIVYIHCERIKQENTIIKLHVTSKSYIKTVTF